MAYGSDVYKSETVWKATSNGALIYSTVVNYHYAQDPDSGTTKLTVDSIQFKQHYAGWGMSDGVWSAGAGCGASSDVTNTTWDTATLPPNFSTTTNTISISKSVVLSANSNGDTTGYIYWYSTVNHADSYRPRQSSWTYFVVPLPHMDMASKWTSSASNVNVGSSISVSWKVNDSGHKYQIKLTDSSGNVWQTWPSSGYYTSSQNSQNITPSVNLATKITTSTSSALQLRLYTYTSSGTSLGYDTDDITLTIPASYIPSISAVNVSGSYTVGGITCWLTNLSNVVLTISATLSQGSPIKMVTVETTIGSTTIKTTYNVSWASSGNQSLALGYLSTAGALSVKITLTDARGRSSAVFSKTIGTVYVYGTPSGTISISQDNINNKLLVNISGNISSVSKKNTGEVALTVTNDTTGVTIYNKTLVLGTDISALYSGELYKYSQTIPLVCDGNTGSNGSLLTDTYSVSMTVYDAIASTSVGPITNGGHTVVLESGGKQVTLFGSAPATASHTFRIINSQGNIGFNVSQFDADNENARGETWLYSADGSTHITEYARDNGSAGLWYGASEGFAIIEATEDNTAIPKWSSIGDSETPIYMDASGIPKMCSGPTQYNYGSESEGYVYFIKQGHIINFYGTIKNMTASAASHACSFTLPSGLRPKLSYQLFPAYNRSAPYAANWYSSCWISNGGVITIYKLASQNITELYICGSYIAP